MHTLKSLLWMLFIHIIRISAAPTSTSITVASSTGSATSTTPSISHSVERHLATVVPGPPPTDETSSGHHTLQIPPTASIHTNSFTWNTGPLLPTHSLQPAPSSSAHPQVPQTPIAIFFEVVCGVAGFILILGFLRCLNSYRKTPGRDRVADVINRHRIQTELDEMRQRRPHTRVCSEDDPLPPYIPRPPSYVEPSSSRGPQYTEVPNASPPSSPLMVARPLETRSVSSHSDILVDTVSIQSTQPNPRAP